MQLSNIRSRYKPFDVGAPHFFLFGMGNRDKFVYKDYQLIDIDNDSIIFHAKEALFDYSFFHILCKGNHFPY